jgi:hypothetical protein
MAGFAHLLLPMRSTDPTADLLRKWRRAERVEKIAAELLWERLRDALCCFKESSDEEFLNLVQAQSSQNWSPLPPV